MKPLSRPILISLRILALTLATLVVFALTAILCETLMGDSAGVVTLAVLCGLIIWLFVAVFHIMRVRIVVPVTDSEAYLQQLSAELAGLGYHAGSEAHGCHIFRPNFMAFLFGGSIRAETGANCVTLIGPKVCLERARKCLRLHFHIKNTRSREVAVLPSVPSEGIGHAYNGDRPRLR
jgi:hypothetical protein